MLDADNTPKIIPTHAPDEIKLGCLRRIFGRRYKKNATVATATVAKPTSPCHVTSTADDNAPQTVLVMATVEQLQPHRPIYLKELKAVLNRRAGLSPPQQSNFVSSTTERRYLMCPMDAELVLPVKVKMVKPLYLDELVMVLGERERQQQQQQQQQRFNNVRSLSNLEQTYDHDRKWGTESVPDSVGTWHNIRTNVKPQLHHQPIESIRVADDHRYNEPQQRQNYDSSFRAATVARSKLLTSEQRIRMHPNGEPTEMYTSEPSVHTYGRDRTTKFCGADGGGGGDDDALVVGWTPKTRMSVPVEWPKLWKRLLVAKNRPTNDDTTVRTDWVWQPNEIDDVAGRGGGGRIVAVDGPQRDQERLRRKSDHEMFVPEIRRLRHHWERRTSGQDFF